MPAVVVQYVSKPKPGSSLETIMQLSKEAAALWRKHGGEVSYWSVVSGEVGNLVFVARFDSFEAYGRTMAAIAADPISMEWQAKRLKAGQAEWVRANTALEIEI
jgi:hypothetical protein